MAARRTRSPRRKTASARGSATVAGGLEDRPLSVVVPCYNESGTVRALLSKVAAEPAVREIIVVDDGSTDGTREILEEIRGNWPNANPPLRLFFQPRNRGKGAALRTGFAHVRGRLAVVQDADLEYDPREYGKLIRPLLEGEADAVYGSRVAGSPRRAIYFWNSVGNRLVTLLSNLATNLALTDMETCYKAFRSDVLASLPLRCDGFGFEAEVTARLARRGCRVYEVPVSYRARTYAEGKKIRWRDGLSTIGVILRCWLFRGAP